MHMALTILQYNGLTYRFYHCLVCCSQIVAVAARNLEDAQKFAEKHSIPAAYGSYKELSLDPAVGPSASSLIGC